MSAPESEKQPIAPEPAPVSATTPAPAPAAHKPAASDDGVAQTFFGEPLVGFDPSEITGSLVVLEGMDGSGRSTQIALLQERLESAFAREFKKAQAISYWEAGRDMSLSHDLYWSFIRYQTMIQREFEVMAKRNNFIELDGEASVPAVNKQLRQKIGESLGIRATKYSPSSALQHLWR